MKREWYRFEAKAQDAADIYVYGDIGKSFWDDDTVTASKFIADLGALPESVKTIRVHVNSRGGSVFEAHAIANALRAQRTDKGRTVETYIDGLAASAATIITSAGNPIRIADNAMMMVHEPSAVEMGTSKVMRKMADALDGIRNSIVAAYRWVSSKSEDELSAMMEATTWMDPAEAVANGFATEIVQGAQVTACLTPADVSRLGEVPEKFRARLDALTQKTNTPPAAAAADVLRLCREGECLDEAEALITAGATLPQVEAKVAAVTQQRQAARTRADQIRAACKFAHVESFADSYISGGMSVEGVKAQLLLIAPLRDAAHIDGSLKPEGGRSVINVSAVYAARNAHAKKE